LITPHRVASLTLFGRSECHLCEQAQAVLQAVQIFAEIIDIDDSPELGAQYGLRIPVLAHPDGRELDWPFSPDGLELLRASAHP
jgi:hypothetical protein